MGAAHTVGFDSFALRAVVSELRPWIVGARVQHVGQPSRAELCITLRAPGATRHLLISWDARYARVHALSSKPTNMPEPPTFCMALRKHLQGGVVTSVAQEGFDRILVLEVGRQQARYQVIAELMGRHSNLVVVDETRTIVDCAKHVGSRLNRFRVILPGYRYEPPPRRGLSPFAPAACEALARIAALPRAEWGAALAGTFEGMSPVLRAELLHWAGGQGLEAAWAKVVGEERPVTWRPVVLRLPDGSAAGAYPLPLASVLDYRQEPARSVNAAVETAFRSVEDRDAAAASCRCLKSEIAASIAARAKQIQAAQAWERDAAGADRLRQLGDNVLAAGEALVLRGGAATAPDLYGDGGPVSFRVEPGLNAHAIADNLYRQSRRLHAGAERWRERRRVLEEEVRELERALRSIEGEPDCGKTADLRRALTSAGLLRAEPGAVCPGRTKAGGVAVHGVREYRSPDGWDVLLGVNAEGNDALLRLCSPDDLWFHVRSGRSAHVAIRTAGRPGSVPEGTIRFAARLTARHSRAKHSSLVPVDYTERKFVRRPRGAAHGRVTYRNERTLDVTPASDGQDDSAE